MPDVDEAILGLLEEIAQTDEVRENLSLPLFESELLDSIGIVQLLAGVSQKLGLNVPLTDFDPSMWDTPQHIIDNVRGRL